MQIKRIVSIVLALALLCALPVSVRAAGTDLRAENLSGYPIIRFHGGFHNLFYDENTPAQRKAFDPNDAGAILGAVTGDLLDAIKSLNLKRAGDVLVGAMREWFKEIVMDESGESVNSGITFEGPFLQPGYFEDNPAAIPFFNGDWRLSPIENADRLHQIILAYEAVHGKTKYNFDALSAPAAIVLAYIDKYGTDRVASLVFNVSLHRGSSFLGAIATRRFKLSMEALAQSATLEAMAFSVDMSAFQPIIRGLFEPGILDVAERLVKLAACGLLERMYEDVFIPLIFQMPAMWVYVPPEDFAKAKKALFKGQAKYNGLENKIDAWYSIAVRADEMILDLAKTVKVAVWAGYGRPLLPVGDNAAVQSDGMVDTHYASLGATCAIPGLPFLPFCKQKINDGHDHMSPDRLVDASTCLLPEATWFAKNKVHVLNVTYDGWWDWFLATPNPTVFKNPRYPQFMEIVGKSQFVPLEAEAGSPLLETLKAIGLYLLRIWRWLLRLPLVWVDWVT